MNLPDFLVDSPDGEIRLTGHRISLLHVVDRYNEGMNAEAIAVEYPTLALAHIHKTLAFYLENRAEVDAYVAECHEHIDRFMAAYVPSPAVLRIRKLMEDRARVTEAT
jgi:uncharacterized protein (DUF433 family)